MNLKRLLPALKAAIAWPSYGGQGRWSSPIQDWTSWHGHAGYDYTQAAGELYRNGVVMACAAWIMRAFCEPELQVVQEDEDGEENEVPQHPLTLALRKPNPFYGADCLWQRIIFDRSIHGQAYLYKERNAAGKIIALWHVPQHRLMPQWEPSGKEFLSHYLFVIEQRSERVPVEDVVSFRFAGDPHYERNGLSTLGAGLREVAALNEGANYRGAILRNMGVPSHIIQGKDPTKAMTAEQARTLHALWAERVSGANRGKPIIPNWALEAIKIGMSPQELDLGSMNYENADLVCSLFGLSAMVVGLSSGSVNKTYSNFPEAREAATENCLVPAWKQMAQDLTLQLLRDYSNDPREFAKFDLSKVRALQEDQTDLWARIDKAVTTGWIQVNEARALVNLPPITGGDVFLPSGGAQPVDLEREKALAAAAAQAAQPPTEGGQNAPQAGTSPNGNGKVPAAA